MINKENIMIDGAVDKPTIMKLVTGMVAGIAQVNPIQITLEASLVRDIGYDSIRLADFYFRLEKEFGLESDDVGIHQIETVGQAVEYVASRLMR